MDFQEEDEIQGFCCAQNGQGGIYPHYEPHRDFVWSPDGEKIAFASFLCGVIDIYVVDADGDNLKRLTKNARASSPEWSPDGEKIAFDAVKNGNIELFVMNADGSHKERLTQDPDGDFMFKWYPDGKRIIFLRRKGQVAQFYVMDTDGSSQEQLINLSNWGRCSDPVLSPDGKKIVVSSERNKNEDIYVMKIGESTPRRLTTDPHRDFHPVWSPNGEMIAFGRGVDYGTSEIYIMNADGSNLRKLTDNVLWNVHIAWSPDGKKIAFESDRDGNEEIYVINTDGSNLRRLTNDPSSDERPKWSPDGKKIMFRSKKDESVSICVMKADGTSRMKVADFRGNGPLWFCFETSQLVYWLAAVIATIAAAFFYFKHTREHLHEGTKHGVKAGILCGITISVLMLIASSLESSIYTAPFRGILMISFTIPGILIVHFGKEVINSTDDLIAPVAAAATVFSLFFVFNTAFFDIHSGCFNFFNIFLLFGLFFLMVFMLSIGFGLLYAKYVLGNPIPK